MEKWRDGTEGRSGEVELKGEVERWNRMKKCQEQLVQWIRFGEI
jgi:hypothetical protein